MLDAMPTDSPFIHYYGFDDLPALPPESQPDEGYMPGWYLFPPGDAEPVGSFDTEDAARQFWQENEQEAAYLVELEDYADALAERAQFAAVIVFAEGTAWENAPSAEHFGLEAEQDYKAGDLVIVNAAAFEVWYKAHFSPLPPAKFHIPARVYQPPFFSESLRLYMVYVICGSGFEAVPLSMVARWMRPPVKH